VLQRLDPNLRNDQGRTPLLEGILAYDKSAVSFASYFNHKVKNQKINLPIFEVNCKDTGIYGRTPLQWACFLPSLALIVELSSFKNIDYLALDNNLELAIEIVPKNYLTSRKSIQNPTKKAIIKHFQNSFSRAFSIQPSPSLAPTIFMGFNVKNPPINSLNHFKSKLENQINEIEDFEGPKSKISLYAYKETSLVKLKKSIQTSFKIPAKLDSKNPPSARRIPYLRQNSDYSSTNEYLPSETQSINPVVRIPLSVNISTDSGRLSGISSPFLKVVIASFRSQKA